MRKESQTNKTTLAGSLGLGVKKKISPRLSFSFGREITADGPQVWELDSNEYSKERGPSLVCNGEREKQKASDRQMGIVIRQMGREGKESDW